jgi:deoxyribose-phosphate aldolase
MSNDDLCRFIDHTLLRPDATAAQVARAIDEAGQHGFASVCIPPIYVGDAARRLAGTAVHAGTVVGFPLGYVTTETRIAESLDAIDRGAQELDTVLNLSWLKSGEDSRVLEDLAGWVIVLRELREGLVLKVILETALLTEDEKARGTRLVAQSGADFVKTSTGFGGGGATVADVALLFGTAAGRIGVKASGGIRDTATARSLIAAGASRLGTSAGVALVGGE